MPLEEVLVRYDADMKDIKKQFADLKKQITDIDDKAKKSGSALDNLGTTINGKLSSAITNLGKSIGAAFSIRAIYNFTQQALRLANEAHDIKAAFNDLNDPLLLNNLRNAVKGTLDDVKLMQKAVEARNLGIPINSLAKSFEFAKLRADQTGKSVESLIDSIITGIGRQSTRSLINLGVSTERFNSEVQKSGDYFKALTSIIDTELTKAGPQIEDTGDKVEQMRANVINLTTAIGEKLLPVQELWLKSLNGLATIIQTGALAMFGNYAKAQNQINDNFEKGLDLITPFIQFAEREAEIYPTLTEALEAYNQQAVAYVENVKSQGTAAEQTALLLDPLYSQYLRQIKVLGFYVTAQNNNNKVATKTEEVAKKTGDTYKYTTTQLEKYIEEIQKAFEPLNFLSESFTEAELAIQKAKQEMMEFVIASGELARGETMDGARRVEQLTDQIEQVEDYGNTWQETMLNIVDQTSQAFAIIDDIQNRSTSNRIDQLDLWLEQGKITQRAYDDLRKKALEKEAKQEKLLTLFSIGLELAKAIASLNVIGIIGSSIQLGLVASEPIPKFKKGVVGIKGPGTETSDEILARLSKGESVVTAKGTKQDVGLFKAANKLKLPEYINENYVLPQLKLQMAQHKKEQGEIAKALKNLKNNFDDSDMIRTMFEQMNVQKDGVKKMVNAIKSNHSIRRNY